MTDIRRSSVRAPCATTRLYDEELSPHGIGIAQMNLLIALGAAGELAPSQIGAFLDIEKSTLSRTLRHLEAGGFIELDRNPDGTLAARLAPRAERTIHECRAAWERAQRRARETLGPELAAILLAKPL